MSSRQSSFPRNSTRQLSLPVPTPPHLSVKVRRQAWRRPFVFLPLLLLLRASLCGRLAQHGAAAAERYRRAGTAAPHHQLRDCIAAAGGSRGQQRDAAIQGAGCAQGAGQQHQGGERAQGDQQAVEVRRRGGGAAAAAAAGGGLAAWRRPAARRRLCDGQHGGLPASRRRGLPRHPPSLATFPLRYGGLPRP